MVLRGSNIAPDSLREAEERLLKAREALLAAQDDLKNAQNAAFDDITEESTQHLSKSELIGLVQELQKKLSQKEQQELSAEINEQKAKNALINTFKQLACGATAGAIARTTVAPIDRVKISMQTSHLTGTEAKHKTMMQSFRNIVRTEGVFRLWRGNLTNCLRVMPHTATQFVAYDKYKNMLVKENEEITIAKRLMSGALSGMTAATVTHPMDVVRIRLQTQSELRGISDAMKHVYRENGLRTFYKGYTPAMISLSPFIAINFATMDTLKQFYFGGEDRNMTKKQLQSRNPFSILFLGACSGIFAQTCCYPLDTVRRRMQVAGKNYSSTPNAFATIMKTEGMKGFYKGMSANALKVVPNNAIRFAAFDFLKTMLMKDDDDDERLQRLRRQKTALGNKQA